MTHEEQIKWMTDQITKLEGQYKSAMDTTAMLMSKIGMTDCPNCEYHKQRAQLWRDEAYKQSGHPLRRNE